MCLLFHTLIAIGWRYLPFAAWVAVYISKARGRYRLRLQWFAQLSYSSETAFPSDTRSQHSWTLLYSLTANATSECTYLLGLFLMFNFTRITRNEYITIRIPKLRGDSMKEQLVKGMFDTLYVRYECLINFILVIGIRKLRLLLAIFKSEWIWQFTLINETMDRMNWETWFNR